MSSKHLPWPVGGFIIDVIVAGDLPGVVAIHFDDLREIVIDGIKGQVVVLAPGDCFLQGFTGPAGPEDEFIPGLLLSAEVFN